MFDEFRLPDGTVAACSQDIDKYLKRSGAAYSGDYSPEFYQKRRAQIEKAEHDDCLADFVQQYKKRIWND